VEAEDDELLLLLLVVAAVVANEDDVTVDDGLDISVGEFDFVVVTFSANLRGFDVRTEGFLSPMPLLV